MDMIYIFTALYCEANIFIRQFHLKKVMESACFQQFASESGQMLLTISGVGEIAAASAVSSVCTQYPPGADDYLLNIGSCAKPGEKGGIFLIHKLTEYATGKTFYPDILYKHGFLEAEIVTGMVPWENKRKDSGEPAVCLQGRCLYDMEAAAVYQAGAYFFGPHQMVFLKLVSDSGEGDRLTGDDIGRLMEAHQDSIFRFCERLLQIAQAGRRTEDLPEQWFRRLCEDMHCSKAMGDSLKQYIRYAVLAGVDYQKAVQEMYQGRRLPCKDKREGKQRFEEFKQRLL